MIDVPIHSIDLDLSIVDHIHELRSKVPSKKRSNQGGWQSPFYNAHPQQWEAPHKWVAATIDQILAKAEYSDQITYWFNVNGPGHFNNWHDHGDFGDKISGCLYIQVPEDSGNIEFHKGKEFTSIQPRPGMLILFANNIKHRVLLNSSNEDRITMAFNLWRM